MREGTVHRIATRSPDGMSGPRRALVALAGSSGMSSFAAEHRSADGGGPVAIIAPRRAGGAS
jgi:hypothetical protein